MTGEGELALRRVFRVSLLLKAFDSFLELAGGVLLYVVTNAAIVQLVHAVTHSELSEDPSDIVANYVLAMAQSLSVDQKSAAAIYLASHGAIKLVLVIMVLRDRSWAYPAFMGALALLIAYQGYRLSAAFSAWLFVLTVFDAVVLWLTWHEFRLRERHRRASAAQSPGGAG